MAETWLKELYGEGLSKEEIIQPVKNVEDKWKILPAFLKSRGLVRQHIESFNHFINTEIKQIMLANQMVTCECDPNFYLKYTDIHVGKPSVEEDLTISNVTPNECRLREMSYAAPITVDVEYTLGKNLVRSKGIVIGRMPIMLRSCRCVLLAKSEDQLARIRECPYDPGGYFVIKGQEKVILIQEQLSKNRIIIETDKTGAVMASVTSSTHERKSKTSMGIKNNKFYLHSNILTEPIPVVIILRALGVVSDHEVVQLIGTDVVDSVSASLEEASRLKVFTAKQALTYIGSKMKMPKKFTSYRKSKEDVGLDVLCTKVLSHIPVTPSNMFPKAVFVAAMVRRMIMASKDPKLIDDKDYYGNKRLELAGQLIALLFEDLFKRFNHELSASAEKVLNKPIRAAEFDILKDLNHTVITNGLFNSISNGNWTVKRFRMERAGVTATVSRLSFAAALGTMTRISSQFEKTRKVSGPRALQASQWGMLCPSDTPEGEGCGLVKNLALLTHITTDSDEMPIARLCFNLGVEDLEMMNGEQVYSGNSSIVFVNGRILGMHRAPDEFCDKFRQMRRKGVMSAYISIYHNKSHRTIYIACDGGRVCRPVIIVENGVSRLKKHHVDDLTNGVITFNDFLKEGIVEYVDVNEENATRVAVREHDITEKTTHLEIDPMAILGIVANLIPYPHHNQSPRNTYQCAMGKQAIGAIAYNQFTRIDTLLYLMVYPQRPMVQTKTVEMVGFDKLPAGQNATVAVMSFSGYDIEDAVVVNKSSIERGYGRCMVMRKTTASVKRYPNQTSDRIAPPPEEPEDPRRARNFQRFQALDKDGIARVGAVVQSGDILINKEMPNDTSDNIKDLSSAQRNFRPCPVGYKGPTEAIVDKVLLTSNEYDHFLIKVLMRKTRSPEVGDKFSSRHGQKGVCGIIVKQEDLPFNDQGICPDMIMNPHGFPSRMTVGKMIELLAGKAGVMQGQFKYGTAFAGDKVEDVSRILVQNKFNYHGKDVLTSGITGEPLQAYIYMGPVYYQKLKHMVLDKMHSRARGPRAGLTRQPTEGRQRDGGLRLGEMERDCLICYGASNLLVERLLVSSDQFPAEVCPDCGLIGYSKWCQYCKKSNKMAVVHLPYACKLLFQELQAMNILPRMSIEPY